MNKKEVLMSARDLNVHFPFRVTLFQVDVKSLKRSMVST